MQTKIRVLVVDDKEAYRSYLADVVQTMDAEADVAADGFEALAKSRVGFDVILLDADRPHMTPVRDAVSAVIHQAQGHEVDTVICDGDIVMRDGVVTTLDESSILQRARETATAVIERSGLDSLADHDR